MGFFSRLGNRIKSGLHSAARIGKKVLGNIHRVGNTIANSTEKVVNFVDRVPVLGQIAAPVSAVVRSGIGLVRDVADASGSAKSLLEEGESVLESGDISKVGGLVKSAKSKLEKGSQIKADAKQILGSAKKLTGGVNRESAKNVGRKALSMAKAEAQERMGM